MELDLSHARDGIWGHTRRGEDKNLRKSAGFVCGLSESAWVKMADRNGQREY